MFSHLFRTPFEQQLLKYPSLWDSLDSHFYDRNIKSRHRRQLLLSYNSTLAPSVQLTEKELKAKISSILLRIRRHKKKNASIQASNYNSLPISQPPQSLPSATVNLPSLFTESFPQQPEPLTLPCLSSDSTLNPQSSSTTVSFECAHCEFTTKVRLNMVRHLQMHAESQPAPSTAPVNPVPHLETNEMHFDHMVNLASSSLARPVDKGPAPVEGPLRRIPPEAVGRYPLYVPDRQRYACGAAGCSYISLDEVTLRAHWETLHADSDALTRPTMDLKPWHCGLCNFNSMIRPEVVEHCFKCHQSKMQFKCFYCPYHTSAEESVTKHQANVHPGKKVDVFHFYYREGSVPGEGDPLWKRQRQRCGLEPLGVKREPSPDLNIVKQEGEPEAPLSTPLLCSMYGRFCEPNGLHYKCPLCKSVTEPVEEAMRSHLYEELNYRRVFHKTGLSEHMKSEHRTATNEPTQIPVNVNIEAWVVRLLQYQAGIIVKNKENLAKQKIVTERPPPKEATPSVSSANQTDQDKNDSLPLEVLIKAFGPLGKADGTLYCCPKCSFQFQDESIFSNHMESELNKIRWCCSMCTNTFQTYHEAQFHCRSMNDTDSVHHHARPVEAPRSPALRATWLKKVVSSQKEAIQLLKPNDKAPEPDAEETPDNALLVVRCEKIVTPEEPVVPRKRPASPLSVESEDEEQADLDSGRLFQCPYCVHRTKYRACLKDHMYRHFNLRPYNCKLCKFNGLRWAVANHLEKEHSSTTRGMSKSSLRSLMVHVPLPPVGVSAVMPQTLRPPKMKKIVDDGTKNVCLICQKSLTEEETARHGHENMKSEFGKKGDIVIKCCTCLILRIDMDSFREHHAESHPNEEMNYAFSKLLQETREVHCCSYCKKRFKYTNDLRSHHNAVHSTFPLKYNTNTHSSPSSVVEIDDDVVEVDKGPNFESPTVAPRKVARKSTTKLPAQAVAKKSTTKLPFDYDDDDDVDEEYSYYGDKPLPLDTYANVTTLMSFCNRMVPFTVPKLSELIKMDPVVLVEDLKSNLPPGR